MFHRTTIFFKAMKRTIKPVGQKSLVVATVCEIDFGKIMQFETVQCPLMKRSGQRLKNVAYFKAISFCVLE